MGGPPVRSGRLADHADLRRRGPPRAVRAHLIYFANPSTEPIRDAIAAGRLGCITTPDQRNVVFPEEWSVVADNGCFSQRWTEGRWWSWLVEQPRTLRWAVCPDVFDPSGGPCHEATLERWRRYSLRMRLAGFTPAFVCQVGSSPATVPDDAEVLFLGGTTEWKLGADAEAIARAHAPERWVHMGRVNSRRRLALAREWGCQSADGTFLTFGPDLNLDRLLRYLEHTDRNRGLFDG